MRYGLVTDVVNALKHVSYATSTDVEPYTRFNLNMIKFEDDKIWAADGHRASVYYGDFSDIGTPCVLSNKATNMVIKSKNVNSIKTCIKKEYVIFEVDGYKTEIAAKKLDLSSYPDVDTIAAEQRIGFDIRNKQEAITKISDLLAGATGDKKGLHIDLLTGRVRIGDNRATIGILYREGDIKGNCVGFHAPYFLEFISRADSIDDSVTICMEEPLQRASIRNCNTLDVLMPVRIEEE